MTAALFYGLLAGSAFPIGFACGLALATSAGFACAIVLAERV